MSIRRIITLLACLAIATLAATALAQPEVTAQSPQLEEAATAGKAWTRITTTPTGATILIKNEKHGLTPKKIMWPKGKPPTVVLKKGANYKSVVVLKKEDRGQTKHIKLRSAVSSPF